jgi:hypothetical protein
MSTENEELRAPLSESVVRGTWADSALELMEAASARLGKGSNESLSEAAERVASERDELKAELARWRGNFDGPLAFVRDHTDKAFKRGAEAMREAAASCVGSDVALLQTYRSVLEGRIRDLPTPEDK